MVTTSLLRSCLDDAFEAATQGAAPQPLRVIMREREKDVVKVVSVGSLSAASGNSRSTAFSNYGPGNVTALQMAEVWRSLIDLFDKMSRLLTRRANGLVPTDFQVKDAMMEMLQAPFESYADFTRLRMPTDLELPNPVHTW